MKKRFADYSIIKKMNITLVLFIMLPILIVGCILGIWFSRVNTDEINKETFQNLNSGMEETQLCREQVEDLYLECLLGKELQRIGQNRVIGRDYVDFRQWLNNLYVGGNWYDNICITLKDGQQFQAGNCVKENFEEVREALVKEGQKYTWRLEDTPDYYFLEKEKCPDKVLTFYALIESADQELVSGEIGVVSARVREDDFEKMYSKYFDSRYSKISYISQSGTILSSTNKEEIGTQSEWYSYMDTFREKQKGSLHRNGVIGVFSYHPQLGVIAVAEIPWKVFYAGAIPVFLLIIVAFSLCLLFAWIFGYIQKSYIIRPLYDLAETFGKVDVDHLPQIPEENREDEVGVLQKSFNGMTERLDRLINDVYRVEYEKKEAQLQALTEQINPHFLYNTLDSIRWKALRNKDSEVAEQIVTLSDFYRYILNKGNEFLTVQDETLFLKRYLYLMKMRFGDRITWDIITDENVMQVKIPKLILQPLVENAVMHGLEPMENGGKIVILAEQRDEKLILSVSDTGIGFEQDIHYTNEEVMKLPESFALKNIYNRLKLFYGEKFEYRIYSKKMEGTKVEIQITQERKDEFTDRG